MSRRLVEYRMHKQSDLKARRKKGIVKLIMGVLFISTTLIITSTIAFADADISSLLGNWYETKYHTAIGILDDAVKTETEVQKLRLQETINQRIKASAKELDRFTNEEKEARIKAVQSYTDKLIAGLKISNAEDKQQIEQKLEKIQLSTEKAMRDLTVEQQGTTGESVTGLSK